jgi:dUTP pyrophosphatase
MSTIEFQLVNDEIATNEPRRGSMGAAGLDLWGVGDDVIFYPHTTEVISTNLRVVIPEGCYGRIAPRSGVSMKGFMVNAGVIDGDYTGEIKIMIHNLTNQSLTLDMVKPIAQIIMEFYNEPCKVIVHNSKKRMYDQMTERGENGFGSTDNKKVRTWKDAMDEVNAAVDSVFDAVPIPIVGRIDADPLCSTDRPCLSILCDDCYPEIEWNVGNYDEVVSTQSETQLS